MIKYQPLTLGEIIKKMENCELKLRDEDKCVQFDFGTAIPTSLDSWRGIYSELALGYKLTGYDNSDAHWGDKKAKSLIFDLKEAIGKTFMGWKGGHFTMNESTTVWVANPGNSGNTGIVDVFDNEYSIFLITAYCE